MKYIEYFNTNKIIKVILIDKQESDWYKVKKELKIFGIKIRNYAVYDIFRNICDVTEIYKKHIIIDGIIYEKPYVTIYFDSDISKTLYFNDYEQGREYINKFSKKYNLETITKYIFD